MQIGGQIRYFLGANSPTGFYSLYDHLLPPEEANAIYILKGGPGCGKSTLMGRVAQKAEEAGEAVEYIHCSGDPDSLDAIILPGRKTAIADGTAPHVIEPVCPGAVESYVNMGDCYDSKALNPLRHKLMESAAGYKDCYKRAYRCLNAASEIGKDMRELLETQEFQEKALKRAKGILSREIKKNAPSPGRATKRFLGGVTHRGVVRYYSTAEVLCKRIYVLEDSFGLAHGMLSHLLDGALEGGHRVTVCPSPADPERLEHLILPDLSLAFLSAPPGLVWEKRPYRRVHIDAMVDTDLLRRSKARLRFSKKVCAALTGEAVEALAQAKEIHDGLERLYNPHVDFDRVHSMADELARKILS